jgi:predicted ATPase
MPMIEGFRVRNYRALHDVTLGRLWNQRDVPPLTSLTVVIGRNGVGKSTLFDAFGFLADALRVGVEEACDARGRGGFMRIRTQGRTEPIAFELYYRQDADSRPITYELAVDLDEQQRPYVCYERLRQRRHKQTSGRPYSFLILKNGKGVAWRGAESLGPSDDEKLFDTDANMRSLKSEDAGDIQRVELDDKRKLGIATLGALTDHPRINAFRRFIEGWHLSYFTPDAARGLPLAGPQPHLNVHGDNLGNVVQYMEREHPKRFAQVLANIARKIPGIRSIDTERTSDGRLLLRFNDRGFTDPFYAQQMSDGTLKLFAYMLLLEDPSPAPFLCIEEPENGLYHKLLEALAFELRRHADSRRGSQVFVTTHQPYFVNALKPEEVWMLSKGEDGFAQIKRASDDVLVKNLVQEELPLGALWYSGYLDSDSGE